MSLTLIVFAGSEPHAEHAWNLVSGDAAVREQGAGKLADMPHRRADAVVVLLPGELVTSHDTALSMRSERQIREAVAFAIEDEIGGEIDQQHITLSPAPRGAKAAIRTAYVMTRALAADWSEALTQALPHALAGGVRVMPDYLALSAQEGRVGWFDVAGRILLRDGGWGAAIDADEDGVFAGELAQALVTTRGDKPVDRLEPMSRAQAMQMICRGALMSEVNLIEGGPGRIGAGGTGTAGQRLGVWLVPAALAVAASVAFAAANVVEGITLERDAERVRNDTASVMRSAFPDMTRVVNPRAQLRERLGGGDGGSATFLLLSAQVAEAADGLDGITIDSIRFDAQSGELAASVIFASYDEFSRLRAFIEARGSVFEEGGSRQLGTRRVGEFKVRRP